MAKAAVKDYEENTTLNDDDIDLGEAEDFKLPSVGIHRANLSAIEMSVTKEKPGKVQRPMIILTVTLSPEDPDAPNLPMRKYLTWPVDGDRETMWGTGANARTAHGAQIQSIKEVLTAFGGQESGSIARSSVAAFLSDNIGKACRVSIKQENRKDQVTGEPFDPPEYQANIGKFLPA
jgi:hypothetical protein